MFMMYVVKPVLSWIFILCWWRGTEAKATISISMENRIRVALTGQTLTFNLSLNVPANHTYTKPECYHQSKRISWDKENHTPKRILQSSEMVSWMLELNMHNVSFSGNYSCNYEGQEVHWVVLVHAYEEPKDETDFGIITQICVSGILLIFSVAGSIYILKSYKKQPPSRDKRNEVTEQRPEDSDDALMDDDVASASLYTALQHRTSSIYDMLNPENKEMNEKTSKQKNCKPQENEELDSVYENL